MGGGGRSYSGFSLSGCCGLCCSTCSGFGRGQFLGCFTPQIITPPFSGWFAGSGCPRLSIIAIAYRPSSVYEKVWFPNSVPWRPRRCWIYCLCIIGVCWDRSCEDIFSVLGNWNGGKLRLPQRLAGSALVRCLLTRRKAASLPWAAIPSQALASGVRLAGCGLAS